MRSPIAPCTHAVLDAAARVNTRENVRLTYDQKVDHVIQEIVDCPTPGSRG